MSRVWALLVSCVLLKAAPAFACDKKKLDEFRAQAQSLAEGLDAAAGELLKCPKLRDETLWWLAFVKGARDKTLTGSELLKEAPPAVETTGERNFRGIVQAARNGNYEALQSKINNAALGYVNSAYANLVLARAYAMAGKFNESRRSYMAYLRLVSEDLGAEAEYLYSFIWEGRLAEAESRFKSIVNARLQEPLKSDVQRGLVAIAALRSERGDDKIAGKRTKVIIPGSNQGSVSLYTMRDKYRRYTGAFSHSGYVNLRVASHRIDNIMVDTEPNSATEFAVGKGFTFGEIYYAAAELGYFSAGKDNFFGEALAEVSLPKEFKIGADYRRQPLALFYPLVNEDQGLMRDIFGASVKYRELAEIRGELRADKGYTPHEYYAFTGRLPLWQESREHYVYVKLPAYLEVHPKANPNIPSDPRTLAVGLGFDYAKNFASRWDLKLGGDYSLILKNYRGDTDKTRRIGRVSLGGEALMKISADAKWFIKGFYSKAEEEDKVRLYDLLNFIAVGVLYDNF